MFKFNAAAAMAALMAANTASAAAPTNEELLKTIEELRQEVRALHQRLDAQQAQPPAAPAATAAPAASKVKIGGYGEMHYNNLQADDDENDLEEIDFHRFVLFFGYDFTDSVRFVSEVELEHAIASSEDAGEVEIEQAYLEFDLNPHWRARGGVMLLPVGILNESHEPPTFYGVERNDVENIIIPTTWWAGGASLNGRWDNGLSWDLMVHEGLKVPVDSFRVRSGRQKTSEADASDLAATTRIAYSGIPGLKLAASVNYQSDMSQEQAGGSGLDEGLLYTVNGQFERGPFALRALWSQWDISGDAVEAADADDMSGWYVEPSFKFRKDLGFYTRYEDVDGARDQDRFDQWELGLNYWPIPEVVLKADYRNRSHDLDSEEGRDFDGFDLGLGYWF